MEKFAFSNFMYRSFKNIVPLKYTALCRKKMYLTFTLNFEAVTTLMSGILVFLVFPDLYNSFDTLPICFHGLMNKWQ